MGHLQGKFVTVLVALNFLSIPQTVDIGIFRQVAMLYSHSLTHETQHTLSFDLCGLLSFPC